MTASRAVGVRELLKVVEDVLEGRLRPTPRTPPKSAPTYANCCGTSKRSPPNTSRPTCPPDWVALKLFEGDAEVTKMMEAALPEEKRAALQAILREHDDAFLAVASGRYEWIGRHGARRRHPAAHGANQPDGAARPLGGASHLGVVHPGWHVGPGLLGDLHPGRARASWMDERLIAPFAEWVSGLLEGAPGWVRGMVVDGAHRRRGVGPSPFCRLVVFFAAFALLEDVGCMARAAYVMDNLMHLMGLHGKSFLPLFLGFGCNVPAIMGTRVIDSWPARLLTILIAPLVPCTARMVVVAFLAPIFFGPYALWVSWGLVLLTLVLLVRRRNAAQPGLVQRGSARLSSWKCRFITSPTPVPSACWCGSVQCRSSKKAGTAILGDVAGGVGSPTCRKAT